MSTAEALKALNIKPTPELKSASREIALLAIHIADPVKRARFTALCAKSISHLVAGAHLADEAFDLLPADRRPKA